MELGLRKSGGEGLNTHSCPGAETGGWGRDAEIIVFGGVMGRNLMISALAPLLLCEVGFGESGGEKEREVSRTPGNPEEFTGLMVVRFRASNLRGLVSFSSRFCHLDAGRLHPDSDSSELGLFR